MGTCTTLYQGHVGTRDMWTQTYIHPRTCPRCNTSVTTYIQHLFLVHIYINLYHHNSVIFINIILLLLLLTLFQKTHRKPSGRYRTLQEVFCIKSEKLHEDTEYFRKTLKNTEKFQEYTEEHRKPSGRHRRETQKTPGKHRRHIQSSVKYH